jgi:hypothetical protein
MSEDLYVVYTMSKSVTVEVLGITREVELSWIEGQVGALPVFRSIQAAEAYANGEKLIIGKLERNPLGEQS